MKVGVFLFGGAMLAAAATGGWAKDAVVADQPGLMQPDNVGACDAYGTGFAKLPGTETCVRVSGQVRFEERISNTSRSSSHGRTTLDFETRSDP